LQESRILYVTGMKPKPPPDIHRAALLRALTAGLRRTRPAAADWLERHDDRFSLISWTPLFYTETRDIRRDLPGLERLLRNPVASPEERSEIDSLRRRMARWWHLAGDSSTLLTSAVANPALQRTLEDVGRYLADDDGVAIGIRALLSAELKAAWSSGDRVLLAGHSLGSVIAYDCLWELSHETITAGRIDQFVTLGSPLATRFIYRQLKGADEPAGRRYPKNIHRWANFAARGELVALHRRIEPYFRDMVTNGFVDAVDDHPDLYNHFHGEAGIDPHKSYGYLINAEVASLIGDWLVA
jgi:hypothetical protein